MSEKRFKLKIFGDVDNPDEILLKDSCGQPLASFISLEDARLVRDLMNEQHETIQQLRKELNDYSCTIIQLQDKVDIREALLKQLEDENEQLKFELESFKPVIFESDGKPVTLYKKVRWNDRETI